MLGEREIWRHCGQAVDGGMLKEPAGRLSVGVP